MKKLTTIFAIVFVLGMLLSSCNKKTCPAYSHYEQEQAENPDS